MPDRETVAFVLIFTGMAIFYMFPALIAGARNHHNAVAIFILNLLLGWTLFGWVLALVWACMNPPPPSSRD